MKFLFFIEPLLYGENLEDNTFKLIIANINDDHKRVVTKILGYQLSIINNRNYKHAKKRKPKEIWFYQQEEIDRRDK